MHRERRRRAVLTDPSPPPPPSTHTHRKSKNKPKHPPQTLPPIPPPPPNRLTLSALYVYMDTTQNYSGLGYYRRARMLQSGARALLEKHGGELPTTVEELLTIPGELYCRN